VRALSLSPDARFVAAAGPGGVAVWDREAQPLLRTIAVQGSEPFEDVPNVIRGAASAAFSGDGRLLAWSVTTLDTSDVVIWDLPSDTEVLRIPGERVLGFSPNGRILAVSEFLDDATIELVDIETGSRTTVDQLPWGPGADPGVAASQGQPWRVASGGIGASIASDGRVTLWDVATRQPLGRVQVPGAKQASFLVFDADATRLAVTTAGGALSLIDVSETLWHETACALAGRNLTPEERERHIGIDIEGAPACPEAAAPPLSP
jgi:WD40 repeat protein